jgi:hypothetical protein
LFQSIIASSVPDCVFCDHSHDIAAISAAYVAKGGQARTAHLIDRERLHPAIVRRLHDMCTVLEV